MRKKTGPKTSATLNPEWWRDYKARWKADRKARGLCLYCADGKASDGRPTCRECRYIARIKAQNRRQTQIAA